MRTFVIFLTLILFVFGQMELPEPNKVVINPMNVITNPQLRTDQNTINPMVPPIDCINLPERRNRMGSFNDFLISNSTKPECNTI